MESQTQKQQPNSKSILDMAQKAMRDMDSLIKEMRQARSNVNRLVQTAPSDKPVFLIEASTQAEAKFRQAKTDLNLWIQKHFRGGEEWSDQPEQNDHCEIDEKFNLGHNHHIEVVNGGFLHTCCQMSCRHYENVPGGNYPSFTDGHDEHGTMVGEGELIWTCPNEACQHFRRGKGEDEVDFEPKHAQLQFFTDYFYSGIEDSDSSDDSFDEVYDMVRDEISRDPRRRAVARQDAEDYLRNSLNARFHDVLVDAYRWRNTWCEWDEKVETAYPNC